MVKSAHEIVVPVGAESVKRMPFINETGQDAKFTIVCSDPAVVSVRTPEMFLAAGQTMYVELLFRNLDVDTLPGVVPRPQECFLHIWDENRYTQESRLLRVLYT